jgi:hypothetical protein
MSTNRDMHCSPLILHLLLVSLLQIVTVTTASLHYSQSAARSEIRNGANSQWGEDIFLYENYFYGMVDGIVVESGALDGIFLSNSLMFERNFGWHSILVEANPKNFKKLLSAPRVNSTKIHAALCDVSQRTVHYIIVKGKKNDDAISG